MNVLTAKSFAPGAYFKRGVGVGFSGGRESQSRSMLYMGGSYYDGPLIDLYAVLGVSRRCSDSDIRDSYKSLIRKTHPDRFYSELAFKPEAMSVSELKGYASENRVGTASFTEKSELVNAAREIYKTTNKLPHAQQRRMEEVTDRFQRVNLAFTTLSDPQQRRMYDLTGDWGTKVKAAAPKQTSRSRPPPPPKKPAPAPAPTPRTQAPWQRAAQQRSPPPPPPRQEPPRARPDIGDRAEAANVRRRGADAQMDDVQRRVYENYQREKAAEEERLKEVRRAGEEETRRKKEASQRLRAKNREKWAKENAQYAKKRKKFGEVFGDLDWQTMSEEQKVAKVRQNQEDIKERWGNLFKGAFGGLANKK